MAYCYHFGVKHRYGKVNLNCEIYGYTTPGRHLGGGGGGNVEEKSKRTGYDKHVDLFQNCEIYGPRARG